MKITYFNKTRYKIIKSYNDKLMVSLVSQGFIKVLNQRN